MATNPENPRPIGDRRGMADRIKRILLQPKAEWPVIDTEATTTGALLKGWVAPLAAIGPVAGLIGALTFGYGAYGFHYRPSMRSEEHTSELQSLMRISYAVFCLKNKNT